MSDDVEEGNGRSMKRAIIITASDSGYLGEREDISGQTVWEILEQGGYTVVSQQLLPDDRARLSEAMREAADDHMADLVITTGGTGFSKRDCTPEATMDIIERIVPGIPEAMRAYSMQITRRAMLSRGVAGIRKDTLIFNLPGSPKAVKESLEYILPELSHGLEILLGETGNCAGKMGTIKAVCTSPERGTQKKNIGSCELIKDYGLKGDAHAGNWHRQVSLLSYEKIEEFRKRGAVVEDGAFGENLIVEGIDLKTLPIGTRFQCHDVIMELTQIGKECHSGCEIFQQMGDCIMPREGIFARVLHGGRIQVNDTIIATEKRAVSET